MLALYPMNRLTICYFGCRSFSSNVAKHYGTLAKALKTAKLPVNEVVAPIDAAMVRPLKRPHQRKQRVEMTPNIWAYATAEQYNLSSLKQHINSNLTHRYKLMPVANELSKKVLRLVDLECHGESTSSPSDVIAKDLNVNDEVSVKRYGNGGDVLLFEEGVVVMWNLGEQQRQTVLDFVHRFQSGAIDKKLVDCEAEKLTCVLNDQIDHSQFRQHEILHIKAAPIVSPSLNESEDFLDKYAVSDAMCRSVKLAMRECALENFVDALNPIIDDLRQGKISVNKRELLKKTGELFALRHDISLDSDLLDGQPDFYWDRDQLEKLYAQASNVLCIEKRTKVINEKLNYCLQLGERLDGHLNVTHSVRLERIIIFLIAIEVGFEMIHFLPSTLF